MSVSWHMVDFLQISSTEQCCNKLHFREGHFLGSSSPICPPKQKQPLPSLVHPNPWPGVQDNLLHIYPLCPKYSTQVPMKLSLIWFSLLFLSEAAHRWLPELLRLLCPAQACDQSPCSPLMPAWPHPQVHPTLSSLPRNFSPEIFLWQLSP